MKQTDKQKKAEKMNESMDTQQKARKTYIENHPDSTDKISKKIVENSFILSIAERYNNGKPYDFNDIRQFMKFINDFFRVELKGKSDIPQLDLQNIVKFNPFDEWISNSYQCATFSHSFIMGNSKEEYFKSSLPRLIFYYNDNLGNLDHYQLEINFTWDIHLKYGFYQILEKFNNDNFFDPEKPIYIAKFMHFIMNLYKKFNSIEFKRIMKANTKKKISNYKTICCIECFLALKNENHYRKHEFYKTFYEEWTLPYKISWNNFAKYWNTKIVPDKSDMQIKSTNYYKDSVSESMDAVRKIRKQKENTENAETTEQKAGKFADNIVLKSKIRELFMKYAPEEKNQDLNNPEIFIQIVNGYLTHYLQTPINLHIDIIKEKISSKNGNGFLFNTYYPTQKNLHAWLLSSKNLKNYEMYYNFPFNYIKSKIFFRKNFIQALFKGNIAYDVQIDLKFRLLIENDVVSQIDLIFSAGINNDHHVISEFTIYFPISDLNNSDSVFQIFSCCTKILKRIETPEFLAYILTCRILNEAMYSIHNGIHKNKIIEQYILVSVFMDIDKSGRLQKEYTDNKKLILQTDSAYAKDANDTYHDKLDYARRCFKLCDNEYINSNTQVDESMNAWKKIAIVNSHKEDNAGKKIADETFLSELFMNFFPESKNHDLNDEKNIIGIIRGFIRKKYNDSSIQLALADYSYSETEATTKKYKKYFRVEDNTVMLNTKTEGLLDKEKYHLNMIVFFSYSDRNIESISLNLFYGTGDYKKSRQVNIFHVPFLKDKCLNLYYFIKYLNETIDILRSSQFAAFILTYNELYQNKPNDYDTDSFMVNFLFYSIFLNVMKKDKSKKQEINNVFMFMNDNDIDTNDAREKKTIMKIYNQQLESVNRQSEINSAVSESMDTVRKMRKQKENVENAETTEQKAGKFADNIVSKSKIRELFMKYAPDSKSHDLNDAKNILRIINGFIQQKCHQQKISIQFQYNRDGNDELGESSTVLNPHGYISMFDCMLHYFGIKEPESLYLQNDNMQAFYRSNGLLATIQIRFITSGMKLKYIDIILNYGAFYNPKNRINGMMLMVEATSVCISSISFDKDKTVSFFKFLNSLNSLMNKIKTSEFTAYLMLFKKLFFNQNKYLNNHYAKTVLKTKNGEILNTDTSKEFKIIFYYIFKDILTSDTNIELKNELKEENISSKNNSENAFLIKKLYNDELKSVNEYNSNSKSLISESMDTWKKLRSKQKTENADAGKKVAHDLFLTQLFSKFAPDSKSHDLNDTSVLMDVLTGYMKFLYNNPKLKAKHNSNLISNDKVTYSINNPFNSKDARRMDIINSDFCYGVNTIFTIKFVYEYSADFNRENSGQLKYIAFAIAICNCMPDFSLEYDIDQSVKIENQIIGIMKWLHEIQKKLLSMKFMAVLSTNYILQQKSANHSKVFPKYNSLYMAGLELKIFTRLKAENNDSVSLEQKLFLRAQKDMYYKKNTQFKLLWDNMYAIYKKELAKIKTMKIYGISESMDAWKKVKSKQEFKDNTENMTDQLFISKLFMKYYPEAKTYDLNDVPTLANLLQGYIQKRFLRKQGRLIFSGIFSQEELQTVNNFAISNKISDIKKYSDCEVRYDICHLLNLKTEQKLKNLKVFIPLGNETTVKHLTIWIDIFFKVSKYKITGIRFIVRYEIGNSKNETKIILDKDFDSINNLNMIMEIFRIIDALRNDLSSMKFESLLDTTYILQDIGLENIISFSDYQNTTAHKVSLYAPAIKTFSFMKMGKSEISYEEYELDDDSKTKKGIINFDDNPSETEEISLGLKIFNSEIIRIKGDTTDTELISESMDAWKRFSSTEKDDVAPEELGKNIALKYNLNRLFDQFAPDIDNSNRNTQNLKSVIELLTNFCKEKIDHHYFNKTEFISLKSRAHLYQKDEVELERDKPYIPQIILNPLTKSNENDISLFKYNENHIFLSFKILSLTSEYSCLESIKIKLNFINFGQTVKTSPKISITYQIKNNTDFEAIFSIMKFILGFNEFLKDGKCAALVDTMYLSFTQNHLIPPMSSIYYNQLICDLMKEYDSTGKLQHISEQQQKWIMESKENQLKYEIIYHAYLKQYDKICRKIKKSEGKISESMDAYNKIARQHSNDKIKNNTDEMICRSALMSLCGGQYVEGKSIIEMLKIIIPRIFRKIHGLVPDAEKEPQFIEIPNQDKIKNYPSMQSYGISAIPLISLKKEFSKNINQNSENDTIFTDIQIRSKNILKASTSSDTGTAIITTLSDKTVSELSCKHFTINFNQYDEGYKYAPDPDNYLTLGYRIDFDIYFYIGNPGILKYSEDNDMSYSQKYSILALFIRDMLKALDFLISPLLTEGLKQMLVILKDINLDDLKERKISIINFFTTFEYFFRKHVSNFNGIAYDDVYKDRDEYNTLKYEPEIQENARKFSEKFYDEHLKKLE